MNVVDANVLLSGLRSSNEASNVILRAMITEDIPFAVSPVVALEYKEVLKRSGLLGDNPWITHDEIDVVLDAVFKNALLVRPWFRFRPFLDDPKDDHYIECALAAGARIIVSHDRHFRHPDVSRFGLSVVKAGEFFAEFMRRSKPS